MGKSPDKHDPSGKGRRRAIDRLRDSAGSIDVGGSDDPSAVTGLISISGTLHAIKGGGVYEIKMADQIDPDRIDPSVPNLQQRVLHYGSASSLVRQTLLTANALLRGGMIETSVPTDDVLSLSFAAAKDLGSMTDLVQTISEAHSISNVGSGTKGSLTLPEVPDLEPRVKTFIQKADHVLQSLLGIVKLFFGPKAGAAWFESLHDLALHRYGKDDAFTIFVGRVLPKLRFVRETRNSVEHPKPDRRLIVRNFTLKAAPLRIAAPTIEFQHPKFAMAETNLVEFLTETKDDLGTIFEEMLAGLCSKHLVKFGGLEFRLVELPPDRIEENGVRYRVTAIGGLLPE